MKAWHSTAASLFLLTCLTACGGGGSDSDSEGDITPTPPPTSGGNPPPPPPPTEEGPILHENFGDGLFVNFDDADTAYFFSQDYKALAANDPQDPRPSFYYPTCCFFANDKPADGPEVALDQLGIVNDSGNPSLLLNTGRFTAGQTRPDIDDTDPKKDSTEGAVTTWGELDLSRDYRISFCMKEASGSRNMQVYVDNNTSSESKSFWGGGAQGSRIFNVPVNLLAPGKRVEINVPGDVTLEPGAGAVDFRPVLVGNGSSFLQFRVEGGSTVIFDDLLVEYQDENGQAELPACNVFTPATAPDAPAAPSLSIGDAQITASWSDVLGATRYDLAWNTSDDVSSATVLADVTSPQVLSELANGTEYFVFLRVANSVGDSDWSAAASATPEAPTGDACAATTQVSTTIPWSVYDGCLSPSEVGSVIVDTSTPASFDFGSSDLTLFAAVTNAEDEKLGTALLNTTSDATLKSYGKLIDVFGTSYPRHFTAIARIKADDKNQRGFELHTYFGDANKRVNMQLRPDQGVSGDDVSGWTGGRIQLEKFTDTDAAGDGDTDVKADFNMLDGEFHIYHIAFTMADANTLTAKVYVDGGDIPVIDQTSTGRTSGGENQFYIGENSSAAHKAEVDWIIWTINDATAAKLPSELIGELPDTLGELGAYGESNPNVILSENFDSATDGDGSSSSLFTAEYKSIPGDASLPFYAVTGGGSNMTVASGALSLTNARFTIGDKSPETPTASTDTEADLDGVLDLSQPYRISFQVLANETPSETASKKCQIQVDNNTTGAANSIWEGASRIYNAEAGSIAIGTVIVESDVSTDHSSLLFRCENGAGPITIDNLVIERQ